MMPDKTFSDVHLSAEQVTETHRTLENDLTVTEAELPGMVNLYVEIDGGKLLLTSFKAGKVYDAINAAAQAQAQAAPTNGEPAPAEPPAAQPPAQA